MNARCNVGLFLGAGSAVPGEPGERNSIPVRSYRRPVKVSRISPTDTNKFVMTVDPVADKAPFLSVVEIFEAGGKTPLHRHQHAHEMFYVLSGSGRAFCDGKIARFKIPRHIRFVDSFPMTASGKVQKFKLREMHIKEQNQ